MKLKVIGVFSAACALLAATLAGVAHAAPPYNLTLSGASPGGLWSIVGAAFNSTVAAAYPGSTITYQTSGGGLANAQLLADGKVPIAIVNDFEMLTAVRGDEPFKAPIKDLRVIVRVYPASPGVRKVLRREVRHQRDG